VNSQSHRPFPGSGQLAWTALTGSIPPSRMGLEESANCYPTCVKQ
jgi:hypothetical protein